MSDSIRLKKLEQQLAQLRQQQRRERWPIPPAVRAILDAFYARHPRFASMSRRDALADDALREDICRTTAELVNAEGMADALARSEVSEPSA